MHLGLVYFLHRNVVSNNVIISVRNMFGVNPKTQNQKNTVYVSRKNFEI